MKATTQVRQVKCNKCEHVGAEADFPKGFDFFQNQYIASCPKCDNRQSPGDASMRMFGGKRPFEYIRDAPRQADPVARVMHNSAEAS